MQAHLSKARSKEKAIKIHKNTSGYSGHTSNRRASFESHYRHRSRLVLGVYMQKLGSNEEVGKVSSDQTRLLLET